MMHPTFVLRLSYFPEKIGVNKKGVHKNDISIRNNIMGTAYKNTQQPANGGATENEGP